MFRVSGDNEIIGERYVSYYERGKDLRNFQTLSKNTATVENMI
ncbi:MAG: hypothetical protein ACP5GI_08355 [Sulfolobales archaeon]